MSAEIGMSKTNKLLIHNNKYLLTIILLVMIITYAGASGHAEDVSCFIIFVAVYIQLPGMLILNRMRGSWLINSEVLLCSFFLGTGFLILEYFFFNFIGIRLLFVLFTPCLSAGMAVKVFIKEKIRIRTAGNLYCKLQLLMSFVICLILSCIYQQYAFSNIHDCAAVYLYQDMSWHIGNVALLGQGMPFSDFRFAGLNFNYHYFNDLIFAMCKYCFGLDAWELVMKCSPVLTAYTISLGLHTLFKRYSHRPLLGVFMFVLCGAADTFYILNTDKHSFLLNYHIFSNVNGVAVSLAAVISVYLFYSDIYDSNTIRRKDLLILPILVFVMTGLKGPFAVVLISAMLFTGAVRVIEDHNIKRLFLVSLAVGGSFLATYIFVIRGVENLFRDSNNNRATELSISGTFSRSHYGEKFNGMLAHGDTIHILLYCIVVAVIGGVMAVGVYYLLFIADTVYVLANMLRNKKMPPADRILSVAAGWVGIAGFLLVSHIGFSQVYFLFIGILFIVLESVRAVENAKKPSVKRIVVTIIILNAAVSCKMFGVETLNTLKDDGEHFRLYDTLSDNKVEPSVLTRDEMEGLEWIRNNTDPGSIIATDRIDLWSKEYPSAENDCRFFYYSAFSERQMLIEGYSYSDISVESVRKRLEMNKSIYSVDPEESQNAIKESGTDYIIVSKRFNDYAMDGHDTVFENDDIAVYSVR